MFQGRSGMVRAKSVETPYSTGRMWNKYFDYPFVFDPPLLIFAKI